MLEFKRLTSTENEIYNRAMEVYKVSFPTHEQRAEQSQNEIMGNREYHFDAIYDENCIAGIILYWQTEHFIYVEHFCIEPLSRNKNIGQRALELLKKKGQTIILEIDPITDEISRKRKGFYERAGFKENKYEHIHPPYHQGNHGHSLIVMSYPNTIAQNEYDNFKDYLDHIVMGVESK